MSKKLIHFNIEGASPHTLPMSRLAEYLRDLAHVLGSEDSVHFLRTNEGSASCEIEIERELEEEITSRTKGIAAGRGPKEALDAYRSLRSQLEKDKFSAELEMEDGNVILEFPFGTDNRKETFGPFWEDGSVDGILVKIGGFDETVPVHLVSEGRHYTCNTTREVARDLAHRLYGNPVRVHGKGKWYRNEHGKWELRWFNIKSFDDLEGTSLSDVVSRLRAIPNNELSSLTDPLNEMQKIRKGQE
jgi:hypothetical protein